MDERDYKAMNKDTQGNGVLPCVSHWVSFDFMKLGTRPQKYGKYLICRTDAIVTGKLGTVADGLIIITKLDTGQKSFHLVANGSAVGVRCRLWNTKHSLKNKI